MIYQHSDPTNSAEHGTFRFIYPKNDVQESCYLLISSDWSRRIPMYRRGRKEHYQCLVQLNMNTVYEFRFFVDGNFTSLHWWNHRGTYNNNVLYTSVPPIAYSQIIREDAVDDPVWDIRMLFGEEMDECMREVDFLFNHAIHEGKNHAKYHGHAVYITGNWDNWKTPHLMDNLSHTSWRTCFTLPPATYEFKFCNEDKTCWWVNPDYPTVHTEEGFVNNVLTVDAEYEYRLDMLHSSPLGQKGQLNLQRAHGVTPAVKNLFTEVEGAGLGASPIENWM
ncbi:hypothetical protein PCE1_000417 [Barthelona sp. PCE]